LWHQSVKIAESDFMNDEIIFGRNAVLSFLEAQTQEGALPLDGGKDQEREITDAVAKLRLQLGEEALTASDLKDLAKLSHLPTIKVNKIMVSQGMRPDKRIDQIWQLARQLKIPVQQVDKHKLDNSCPEDAHHQGVMAYVSQAELWSMETFLLKLKLDKTLRERQGLTMDGYCVAIADGIEDPHNLGAIIRSAEAMGVKALFLPQRRSAQVTGTVAKVSAGALANLPVVRVVNLAQTIETLKENGFWVWGLDIDAKENLFESDLKRQLCVIIGGEGAGMGQLSQKLCDFLVKIPMPGHTESLNASVAASIFFYEVVRQSGAK
jgi:23S rRNA (guanosine2251-2'-O)-methyltransferase